MCVSPVLPDTPITGAPYQPAQLLISRQLRDKMLSASNILKPSVVPDGRSTMKRRQTRQKHVYDRGTTTRASHRDRGNVGEGGHSRIPRHVRAPYSWRRRVISGLETVSQGGPQPKHRSPDFDICLYSHK